MSEHKKGCCRECKYADLDADGCTCMIDGRSVDSASDYTCDQYRPAKPLTNADKIRAMSDEELRNFILDLVDPCKVCANERCDEDETCAIGVSKWLRKEADNG